MLYSLYAKNMNIVNVNTAVLVLNLVLLSKKMTLFLQEAGFAPGAILEIQLYLEKNGTLHWYIALYFYLSLICSVLFFQALYLAAALNM